MSPTANKFVLESNAFLVIFDITSPSSFERAESILSKNISSLFNLVDGDGPICYLIGNKTDLEENRKINKNDAQTVAEKHSAIYFECSAKENSLITPIFEDLVRRVRNKFNLNQIDKKIKNIKKCQIF